jgi:protein-disulfide isomerase
MWVAIRDLPLRLCFRHFPVASKHRRAPALHAAAEAAGLQRGEEAFWGMVDRCYGDPGHQDDPHLWRRVQELDLELDRFEADRRSEAVADRVRRDFETGIRAGVMGTPAAFVEGRLVLGQVEKALAELADPGRSDAI